MPGMFSGRSFLVVDDEPDLREILRDELEFAGAFAQEAENGHQALQLSQKKQFDAVISDIRMPGGDGFTLAKNLKAQENPPVVFLVTGFADVAPAEAYHMGVEALIAKPFNLNPMLTNLARALTPTEQRWASPIETTLKNLGHGGPFRQVSCSGSLSDYVSQGKILLGRGGICVCGGNADIRSQDLVSIETSDGVIHGIVRWSHSGTVEEMSTGYGVEILCLTGPILKIMTEKVMALKPKPYIPCK